MAVARPPRPQLHSFDVSSEFVVWAEKPGGSWLRLPRSFGNVLPAEGIWLQADGCCSGASWVEVDVAPSGDVFLERGWQSFARARRLQGRCALHFRYDGVSTLFVRVFSEEGRRLGCCPEADDEEGEDVQRSSSSSEDGLSPRRREAPLCGSSSSSSSGGRDEPPRRRARYGVGRRIAAPLWLGEAVGAGGFRLSGSGFCFFSLLSLHVFLHQSFKLP